MSFRDTIFLKKKTCSLVVKGVYLAKIYHTFERAAMVDILTNCALFRTNTKVTCKRFTKFMSQRIEINLKFEELLTPIDSLLKVVLIIVCLICLNGVWSRLLKIMIEIVSHMVCIVNISSAFKKSMQQI